MRKGAVKPVNKALHIFQSTQTEREREREGERKGEGEGEGEREGERETPTRGT
jgi:hypothetical protein